MSDNSTKFVDYLDKYKSQRQCRYADYLNMLNLINLNYDMNHIADKTYIGNHFQHFGKNEETGKPLCMHVMKLSKQASSI